MQHMFSIKYSGMLCYLTLGDKQNTNEFFLDPEFFLDLGEEGFGRTRLFLIR